MSTDTAVIAGVHLLEQRPTHDVNIEYWLAKCGDRLSEVYFVPKQDRERLSTLPSLVGFTQCQIVEVDGQIAVVMPGVIQLPVTNMIGKIGVSNCIGMAWHIADLLSLLHQSGRAHNLLHPESIGLNDLGELEIRPALGRFIASDPDPKASAIATDCWQMRQVVHYLGISAKVDPLFALLNRGLQEEFARLRLQPATAIRQSISAVLARHSNWEDQFVEQMGKEWALNQRNLQESTIIPHRLQTTRPTLSIDDVKDMSDSIDLWGNLFASSSVDGVSSSQALLLEALSGKQPTQAASPTSRIQLPIHRGDPIEEDKSTLEIDLIGPTSIQIPMKPTRSGLVAIQEVGLGEAPPVEEKDFYHGFSAIVEETAEDLEVLHRRRRRSQARRSTVDVVQTQQVNDEDLTEQISPPTEQEVGTVLETVHLGEGAVVVESFKPIRNPVDDIPDLDEVSIAPAVEYSTEPYSTEAVVEQEPELLDTQSAKSMVGPSDSQSLETASVEVDEAEPYSVEDMIEEQEESTGLHAAIFDEESETVHEASEALSIATVERGMELQVPAIESLEEAVLSEDVGPHDNVERASDVVYGEPVHTEQDFGTEIEVDSQVVASELEESFDRLIQNVDVPQLDLEIEAQVTVLDESTVDESSGEEFVTNDESIAEPEAFSETAVLEVDTPIETVESTMESEHQIVDLKDDVDDTEASEYLDDNGVDVLQVSRDLEHFDYKMDAEEGSISEEIDQPEVTGPVSILNMPLISIVEEDDLSEGKEEGREESEDEDGVSLAFLINDADVQPEVTQTQLEEVFQAADTSISKVPTKSHNVESVDQYDGFVATLTPENSSMQNAELDVEEPLADIDFPSIEEVKAQDKTFAGDVNALFDSAEPVVSQPSLQVQRQLDIEPSAEPKWTGATSFDNLTNSEEALGDEKYAHAQVELGDVDAVLGESIRDFSELERKGSPWAFVLIASLVVIFGIVYVLTSNSSETPQNTAVTTSTAPVEALPTHVEVLTDPPRGKVLIEKSNLGVAPVKWEITEGDVFLMCVDWGSNPVCRRVPRSDLLAEPYTFTQKLTP